MRLWEPQIQFVVGKLHKGLPACPLLSMNSISGY